MDHTVGIIIFAALVAFLTVWGVGAADLANVLSTTLGSKAVSVRTAIIIAIVFEFLGAFFGGDHVSYTLRHNVINLSLIHDPHMIVVALLSVSLAGASWMILASAFGLPASITNSIVGALVGFGCLTFGASAVNWSKIVSIAFSWLFSPIMAGILSYLIFANIQRLILMRAHPDRYIDRYFPIYCFIVGVIFANMIVFKILAREEIVLPMSRVFATVIVGLAFSVIGIFLGRKQHQPKPSDRHAAFAYVEKKFSILMGFTACAMVFAHGSNDVPIAVAPFNIIINTLPNIPQQTLFSHLNPYVLSLGSMGVILGLLFSGRKVIATVGSGITTLTPSRAFSATFATACIVIFSTTTGIPISVTQTLVGGVLGVGLARGLGALNLNVVRNIFMSWFITIPATSLLAVLFYFVLHALVPLL